MNAFAQDHDFICAELIVTMFVLCGDSNYLWRRQSYHLVIDVDVACNNANTLAIIFKILGRYLVQLSTLELVETT